MPAVVNRFLAALSPAVRESLIAKCVAVALPLHAELYRPDVLPQYAFFMTSGVASIVTELAEGDTVEVGLIGNEGVVGALHLLGPALVPNHCFVQIAGTALRLPFEDLRDAFRSSQEVHDRILEFVQQQALNLAQLAACHRMHEAEARLSRWLLMAQDRTQSNVLKLTQEFLSMMLGSRRTTITLVAGAMQENGLIEHRRGQVTIISREKLEAAACDCYVVCKQLQDGLYELPYEGLNQRRPLT